MSYKDLQQESERYTYDYFFLEYVCRLCWSVDGVTELTSFGSKPLENDATIAEKIQECLGIDVTTVTHPKRVCSKCLNEIEIFTEFKRFCQETNRKLHSILENGPPEQIKVRHQDDEHKLHEPISMKQENDIEFTNFVLDDSIDDIFDGLPLAYISATTDHKPVRKERKKRSATYCNMCHIHLENKEQLIEHNLECHGIEENGYCKCFGCDKVFMNVKKRLRHETDICKQLKRGYKCSICDRFLPKRRMYEVHMRAHRENKEVELPEDIFKCRKCFQLLQSTEALKEHMLIHFPREKKTFICDACGRVFTRRDYLKKHKMIHEGSKLHKCPHCDYSARQRSSLTVHMRKHTGERPYACDLCPRRCVTSSNLLQHRKRHFGDKAFQCKLCDKKFGYKNSLEEHMSVSHERSECHTCDLCGSTYSRFRGLRGHLLAKHGKKVRKMRNDVLSVNNKNSNDLELKEGAETVALVENTDGGFST